MGQLATPPPSGGKLVHCPWCQESIPEQMNAEIPKQTAQATTGARLKGTAGEESQGRGELQPHAAKVLMKLLYGAHLARFD